METAVTRARLGGLPLVLLAALLVRLPFLHHAIQGDDAKYLAMAMHAQIDPLHPTHFRYAFTGEMVDMRGFPHPPMNAWILGALLAISGDVRETGFHAAYLLFSLSAAAAVWTLARRFLPDPLWPALLFVATPAFVVNGNSLESDLPMTAFWLASAALWVSAVDLRCAWLLAASAMAAAMAATTGYQAALLAPVLAAYLWERRRDWIAGWIALAAPVAAIAAWQLWTRLSTGALPAEVLAAYLSSGNLQSFDNKVRNALALGSHLGWVAFPALAWVAAYRRGRGWLLAAAVAAPAAIVDANPLFWISIATGALVLGLAAAGLRNRETRWLAAWLLLFFAACLALFFAGSARYLLPLTAPAILLLARDLPRRALAGAFVLQLAVSLALAAANRDHWEGYRRFVASLAERFPGRRVWINGEWGLRYYAESLGALPLLREQPVRPGDLVITSELAYPTPFTTGGGRLAPVARAEISSALPLRLMALGTRSAWSLASNGFRPFDVSRSPIDRVRAETVVERAPTLSYLPMDAPEVAYQAVSGLYEREGANQWRWASGRVAVLLKPPGRPAEVEATFRVMDQVKGCRVTLAVDGAAPAEAGYPEAELYTLRTAPVAAGDDAVLVTLTVDRTFRAPGDNRELGLIVTGIGFRAR